MKEKVWVWDVLIIEFVSKFFEFLRWVKCWIDKGVENEKMCFFEIRIIIWVEKNNINRKFIINIGSFNKC